MRLRNKKTGEIKEWECVAAIIYGEMNEVYDAAEYDSLAELNEEWEDLDATIVRTKNRIEFLERKLKFEKTLLAELCGEEEE